jgi:hypothetical protein
MRSLALCLVLLVGAQAAEDQAALKTITRAIREGDQESLAGLQQQHGPKAAQLVRGGQAQRFGLITTNSLRQTSAKPWK